MDHNANKEYFIAALRHCSEDNLRVLEIATPILHSPLPRDAAINLENRVDSIPNHRFNAADVNLIRDANNQVRNRLIHFNAPERYFKGVNTMENLLSMLNPDGTIAENFQQFDFAATNQQMRLLCRYHRIAQFLLSDNFGLRDDIRTPLREAAINVRSEDVAVAGRAAFCMAFRMIPPRMIEQIPQHALVNTLVHEEAPQLFQNVPARLRDMWLGDDTGNVLRGPPVGAQEMQWLHQNGVRRIVHLGPRTQRQIALSDAAQFVGLQYVNLPLNSFRNGNECLDDLVTRFEELLEPVPVVYGPSLVYVSSTNDTRFADKMFAALRVARPMDPETAMQCEDLEDAVQEQITAYAELQ